ncbi:MAG: tagaturonate reductase [Phycisphaerae bacterium]|nr:tagaturonate reductase [Phycisphaerae bacterium]MDW8262276.1 tagaturonate reductase [Phycisphaerales bacterium]
MQPTLPRLSRELLHSGFSFPECVRYSPPPPNLPERVLQFGEGNFLRGFVDWMIHRLNSAGLFGGRVVVVQPIPQGLARRINEQDGLYTLLLRGVERGKRVDHREIITSISRALDPHTEFDEFLQCAGDPNLRVIISNTTEAGIVFRPEDKAEDRPPASFPGKLTRFLYERFTRLGGAAAPGFIILPCELIEKNGRNLKQAVLQTARNWKLSDTFAAWLEASNEFATTLVDRIVTGYPKDEASDLARQHGYEDSLLVAGEPFHFWAIEASAAVARMLPFDKAGLNVVVAEDITPYRDRKVRILNGGHTMMVPAGFLMGHNTVGECMGDPLVRGFLEGGLHLEIIPTLNLPQEDTRQFASAVLERFSNPFVQHQLLSITLNSVSKFNARVLPSIREYSARFGKVPARLAFSFAALIAFYRGTEMRDGALLGRREDETYPIVDDAEVLQIFRSLWASTADAQAISERVLAQQRFWGEDTNGIAGLTSAVADHLGAILQVGPRAAMERLLATAG